MIELHALGDLDPAAVEQNRQELLSRVSADNPHLYLLLGVFADLLLNYDAALATLYQANVNDYLRARSLLALETDPDLADPDLVDDVLSNFRVVRQPGAQAGGQVTVVVSDDVTVTIASGSVWQVSGLNFTTASAWTAKVEAAQVLGPTDCLLIPTADGNWAFTIAVTAVVEGVANVPRGTLVVPAVPPPNYVTSYAASDFAGGAAPESNSDLLDRLRQGVACRAASNRVNMQAMLREVPEFAAVPRTSIIGMGDPEMPRDRRGLTPVATGGRVDWYVRTQDQVLNVGLTLPATLVQRRPDGTGLWQLALNRDAAPGFYEVRAVQPPGAPAAAAGGYQVVADRRAADLTGVPPPDVDPATWEWVYSRYQTAVIQFVDTDDLTSAVGAVKNYTLQAACLPLVADIQDLVLDRDVASVAADCLVKACVPCFVQVSLTVHKRAGDPDPDLTGMADALAQTVNKIDFVGRLYASQLYDAASAYLGDAQTISSIDMLGRIRYPDGSMRYLRSGEVLVVPQDPASMVGPRTVQFFATPADVGVSVVTDVPATS